MENKKHQIGVGWCLYYIYSKMPFNYGKYNLFYDNDQDKFCVIEKLDDEKINDKFVKNSDKRKCNSKQMIILYIYIL